MRPGVPRSRASLFSHCRHCLVCLLGIRHHREILLEKGRDFNESIPLIEEYLRSSVPPYLLANRPPSNPMESFDLSKEANYFLDPSIRRVNFELGPYHAVPRCMSIRFIKVFSFRGFLPCLSVFGAPFRSNSLFFGGVAPQLCAHCAYSHLILHSAFAFIHQAGKLAAIWMCTPFCSTIITRRLTMCTVETTAHLGFDTPATPRVRRGFIYICQHNSDPLQSLFQNCGFSTHL